MEQGRAEEAIPWFEKAKAAPRYEPRHFPYLNLGRLRAARGEIAEALAEFEGALAGEPGRPDGARGICEALRLQGELERARAPARWNRGCRRRRCQYG